MLYVPSFGVEVAADTIVVTKEATTTIVDVAKEESDVAIVAEVRPGGTYVSARFNVEEFVVSVSVKAEAFLDLTVAMVGAVAFPAVAMITLDAAAKIVRGNQPKGCLMIYFSKTINNIYCV